MARQRISTIIQPYLLIDSDPYIHQNSNKYLKLFTNNKKFDKIKRLKRKDNVMSNKKNNNYIILPKISIALLAIFAVIGLTELLGGELINAVTAGFICFALLAFLYDLKF